MFLHRTRSGEVIKVLDFGIAKLVGEGEGIPAVTGAGGFIGTPTYMAPERLRQGSYDGRSDVYSVGVVLYQMLAGRPPFWSEKDSYLEIVLGHLSEPPRQLNEVNPSVAAPVTQIVMRTLEKDPALRPTAKELLKELMRLMRRSTGQHEMIEGPRSAEPGASSSPGLQPVSALGFPPPPPSSKSQPPGSHPLLSPGLSPGLSPPSASSPMNAAERKDFEDEDTGVALPTAVTIELDKRLIEQTSAQVSGPASEKVSGPASEKGSGPLSSPLSGPVPGPLSGPLSGQTSGQSSGHTSGK